MTPNHRRGVRLATYNVEWFNALFDDAGELLEDDGWSARWNITRGAQIAALGRVFTALDADAVMVIEAPDTSRNRDGVVALETFARRFGLRARRGLIGFANDTQQEIALLYDPDTVTARHDPQGARLGERNARAHPRFDGVFHIDLDTDAAPETVKWSKPPLEVALHAGGRDLRLIGVHAKSKAPHGATTPASAMRIAIENRRKQSAQCIWLRARVDEHLARGESLIVMGDFNDGPGLDEYEQLFGRSGVEIVLGSGATRLIAPHATAAPANRPTTSRFWLRHREEWLEALLDFIMVTPDLANTAPVWRIWHPQNDATSASDPALANALLTASDHFPVTLDLFSDGV
ncbi:endonuclease/exonuclease/phosphatase family protein [Oceaniovalibus sp. ACAM 378]|uniref:endonuclease/exonuclease/phosphatase family protein n=1 Tax=Oceaniovalibus sp. ACAM 378 TaxID=2599923 RepID=UPI0011D802B3|nr:endonuclease/exonuclease/phosphatase family protein [Oceaniovalibus sp. ACAM 378]TYB85585.1 endonuclease [Oceaniovalibus sp. ACAM 378]